MTREEFDTKLMFIQKHCKKADSREDIEKVLMRVMGNLDGFDVNSTEYLKVVDALTAKYVTKKGVICVNEIKKFLDVGISKGAIVTNDVLVEESDIDTEEVARYILIFQVYANIRQLEFSKLVSMMEKYNLVPLKDITKNIAVIINKYYKYPFKNIGDI